jgi:hypothetical protein
MSTGVDLVKRLVKDDLIVEAVELPPNHHKKPLIADDLEEVLAHFDDDDDYAHFIVRVKRSHRDLPKFNESDDPDSPEASPQVSMNALANETLKMTEEIDPPEPSYEPEFLLENAKLLEQNKDFALARNIYQSLIRNGVLVTESLTGLARTYTAEGRLDDAARICKIIEEQ